MAAGHLLTKSYGHVFRFQFPKDIKPLVGKSEIRLSLKTHKLSLAKSRSRMIAGRVQLLIRTLRKGGSMAQLKAEQINGIINQYLREALEEDEKARILDDHPVDKEYHEVLSRTFGDVSSSLKDSFARNDMNAIKALACNLLDKHGLEADMDSFEYKKFCHECSKAFIRTFDIRLNRIKGDYSDELPAPPPVTVAPQPLPCPSPVPPKSSKKLSEIISLFLQEGDNTGQWTPKTRKEIGASLQLLAEILGDVPVDTIDRAMMSEFKQTVIQLPPNMNKDIHYRDKTIPEILKMNPTRTIAVHTINKYLGRAATLLEYARINGHMTLNPAEGMKVKQTQRNVETREVFTQEDLEKLFRSHDYLDDSFRKEYYFWVPLFGLFTGARINEISQLYLSDFQEHDGIWCININDDGDKQLKNSASKRIIPLHPFLVDDLRIIDKVESLKAQGEQRFFHDLTKGTDGYGVYASRWFNERYKVTCGVPDKVFHCFRHTFGTILSHNGIDDHSLKALLGHAEQGTTFDTYVKRGTAQRLYNALVDHLNCGVDLGHLKDSKWIIK